MNFVATTGLFVATALAEIVGCYLPYPSAWDAVGSAIAIAGMAIIMFAPRS